MKAGTLILLVKFDKSCICGIAKDTESIYLLPRNGHRYNTEWYWRSSGDYNPDWSKEEIITVNNDSKLETFLKLIDTVDVCDIHSNNIKSIVMQLQRR